MYDSEDGHYATMSPQSGPTDQAGTRSATAWDIGQARQTTYPDDAPYGYWTRTITRPAYARYLLNRVGGVSLDPVAPAVKTPYTVNGRTVPTWIRQFPKPAGQYHKFGGQTAELPGPLDILNIRAYGENWINVKAGLSGIVDQFRNWLGN